MGKIPLRLHIHFFFVYWRLFFSQAFVLKREKRERRRLGWLPCFVFYAVAVTALALDKALGNNTDLVLRNDPFSGTALLISLAVSAASYGAQYALARIFAPKQKTVERGRLTGDVSIADSVAGAPKVRVYGARPPGELEGGCEVGPNIFWSSEIRKLTSTTPGSGGGKGIGGGSQPTPPTTTITYKVDFAGGVGDGPLRLLRLKFNEDVVYSALGSGNVEGSFYEAEAALLSGHAEIESNASCSGGQRVALDNPGQIWFKNLYSHVAGDWRLAVYYQATATVSASIEINGVSMGAQTFPNTGGALSRKIFSITLLESGQNGIKILNATGGTLYVDRINISTTTGGTTTTGSGAYYEAEDGILDGGATAVADSVCSNGHKVTGIGMGGKCTITVPTAPDEGDVQLRVYYKSTSDMLMYIKVNGTGDVYSFPNTAGLLRSKATSIAIPVSGANIEFSHPTLSCPDIDQIGVFALIHIDPPGGGGPGGGIQPIQHGPTGIFDPNMPPEDAQDNMLLPDPQLRDTRAIERYNLAPDFATDDDNVLSVTIQDGAQLAFYEGSATQPIDPIISADIVSKYGAGSCPAFYDTGFIRVKDLNFSKWGVFPLVRAVVENKALRTVSEILLHEASLVGLEETDFDLTLAEDKFERGFYVQDNSAPDQVFEQLGRLHNLAFVENSDGVIQAIDLADRTPVATLTNNHLGAYDAESTQSPPDNLVTSSSPNESDLPREIEVQFNNPLPPLDYQTDKRRDIYPFTTSRRKETVAFTATRRPEEATSIVRRLLQAAWLKCTPYKFNLTHEHAWLNAGDVVEMPIAGEQKRVRLEEKTGSAPGVYEISATDDELFVVAGADEVAINYRERVQPPANTVGTLMSIPRLEDSQNKPGIYAAATPKDLTNGAKWSSSAAYRFRGGVYQKMATFNAPCLIGRVVETNNITDFLPSEWDTKTYLIADFFGDRTPTTVTEDEALAGAASFVWGNEVCVIREWTRDNDYPNRWRGETMRRGQRETSQTGHVDFERLVFLDSAVRFIALDEDQVDVETEWRFPTNSQVIEHSAPVTFTWLGETVIKAPVYDSIDADVPLVSFEPTITRIDQPGVNEWGVYLIRPDDYGFSIDNVEVRMRMATTPFTVVRQHKIGLATFTRQPMFNFDCLIDYRWRNRHRTGGSDGWSAWSPAATAYGMAKTATQQNAPDSELVTFDNDLSDTGNPSLRKTEY